MWTIVFLDVFMAGFDAPIIEYADEGNGNNIEKRRAPVEYLEERKVLVEFIRNFRRGREAYYRYAMHDTAFAVLHPIDHRGDWLMW